MADRKREVVFLDKYRFENKFLRVLDVIKAIFTEIDVKCRKPIKSRYFINIYFSSGPQNTCRFCVNDKNRSAVFCTFKNGDRNTDKFVQRHKYQAYVYFYKDQLSAIY